MQLFSRPRKQQLQHHMEERWKEVVLRVCVHPRLHYTHQLVLRVCVQLLQYTAFLPRAHGMETKAALNRGQRQLQAFLCCPSLSIYWLLLLVLVFRLPKNLDLCCDTYSDTFRRLATIYRRCNNSSRLLCDKST
jgi:hypothetical protein